MEQDILQKLEEQRIKLDRIEKTMHTIHSYFFWIAVVSIVVFVLPLIGLVIAIPRVLSIYSSVGF